ncbi:MAG: hypothetical protein SF339_07920 [Blastocatellia bacterium]|nr:hypothetical protein [Blastocatellia bacterium]
MRRLSSLLVPAVKLSPFLLGIRAVVVLLQGADEYSLTRVAGLLTGGLIVALLTRRWKSVFLHGNRLYLAGLRSTIEVPLHEVATIEIVSTRRIALTFRRNTDFGTRVVFVARRLGFETPEIAHELSYLVHRARSMHPGRRPNTGNRRPPRNISRVA